MICTGCGREFRARGRQRLCPACTSKKTPQDTKYCLRCGKEYLPHNNNQRYCSYLCRVKKQNEKQAAKRYTLRCAACGGEFIASCKEAKYCSAKCRSHAARERSAPGGPDREITGLTVYLVHKYAAEGMKEVEISELLRRSAASVREALERPLRPYQQQRLQEFLKGR